MKYNNIYIQTPLLDLRKFFMKRDCKVNMIEKISFVSNTNYIKLDIDKDGEEIDIIFTNEKDFKIEKYSKDDLKNIANCLFCLDFDTFNNVKKNGIFSVEDLEIIILELKKIKKTYRGNKK